MEILGIGFSRQILIFFMISFIKNLQLESEINKNSWNEEMKSNINITEN